MNTGMALETSKGRRRKQEGGRIKQRMEDKERKDRRRGRVNKEEGLLQRGKKEYEGGLAEC